MGRPVKGIDLLPKQAIERVEVQLHPGQWQALQSEARVTAVISGTGSGKTYLGPRWLYKQILKHPRGHFLVVAPVSKTLYRSALPALREFLEVQLKMGVWLKGEETFRLKTGGKIYLGTATEPERLEGIHTWGVWLDEAGQMRKEILDIALRRTGFNQAPILIGTTPYSLNWLKTEVFDKWLEGDSSIQVITFPSIWNPTYPVAEFERARREMPDWKFRMYYLGEFTRPEGLVYQDLNPEIHYVPPFDIPSAWTRIGGIDFGYQQATACVWVAMAPMGQFYVYREYKRAAAVDTENAKQILGWSLGDNVSLFYADGQASAAIAAYREAGLPIVGIKPEVHESVLKVVALLRQNRLFILGSLGALREEVEGYYWAKEEGIDKPAKGKDHLLDALRYALTGAMEHLSTPLDSGPEEPSPWFRLPTTFSLEEQEGSPWRKFLPSGASW